MINESPKASPHLEKALAELAQIRQLAGTPKEFWPRFLLAVQQLTSADKLVFLARKPGAAWRRLMEWPADSPPSQMLVVFHGRLEELATRTIAAGAVKEPLDARARAAAASFVLTTRLDLPQEKDECVLIGLLSEASEAQAREAWLGLRLAGHTPESYQTHLAARQSAADLEKLASVLDLAVVVNAETRFLAAALASCNALATRFKCDRVSLGWEDRGYVRLSAISRTEKFDRQMAAAQSLETAMDEAFDQDEEVVWPASEGSAVITRDHERYSKDHRVTNVVSLPLRVCRSPVAVVTCEREAPPFSEIELQQLRLGCDLVAVRLADLRSRDRWFGARWAAACREQAAKLIGPEHTWAKLLALLIVAVLATLVLLRVPYRVEGNFTLRSDALSFLTAPFEGYIDEVLVRPGDAVSAGAPLLKLKTSELQLEEGYALADLKHYERETEKARSAKALAEMRISEALAEQARARLEIVRYRMAHAVITSPFSGVVVEGDLRERLGAPVKAAEVLLKVARVDTLYPEVEVNERDVHEILGKSTGEIAFVSRPLSKFPIHIVTIEPAGLPKNDANVFSVRCAFAGPPQTWWRPGMSGVCKFDVEKRTLLWILTHRTVDFLRLKLWW